MVSRTREWRAQGLAADRQVRALLLVVGFALLTALAAQIRIPLPFTPVPLTLQVFVVMLAGYALSPTAAAASLGLYLGLGSLGLPAFAGFTAGPAVLTGATAGYLWAYPPAAFVVGWLAARAQGPAGRVGAGLVGLVLIHAAGALGVWAVAAPTQPSVRTVLTWSLLPFLGPDVVKVLVAERLSRRLPAGAAAGPRL